MVRDQGDGDLGGDYDKQDKEITLLGRKNRWKDWALSTKRIPNIESWCCRNLGDESPDGQW